MTLPEELVVLHRVAKDAALQFDSSVDEVFDPCGLILELHPAKEYYWCTPTNTLTFARTGGDGVHYSYLNDPRCVNEKTPIIMTVPCASGNASENNLVIAESFNEFFCLGYYVDWFSLEKLLYQPDDAIEYFGKSDEQMIDCAEPQLTYIRDALQLRPEPPNLARIRALNEKYSGLLVVPEFPEET